MGFSLGGSTNRSRSESEASQDVWAPQGHQLGNMYDAAAGTYQQTRPLGQDLAGMAPDVSSRLADYESSAGGGYRSQLGGGAVGDTSDVRSMLMDQFARQQGGSQVGNMYQSIVGGQGNTYIDPMVDAMKSSGMDNLNRMQANTGLDATAMGQSGSSRHAMQNAMQSDLMNQEMLDREMSLRGGAYDKDLAMKMGIAQQADTNALTTQRNLMDTLGMSDQSQQSGLDYATNMQNLGMGTMAPTTQAMNAPWMNMQNYANVMGDPTVLGSASSMDKASGGSLGFSF